MCEQGLTPIQIRRALPLVGINIYLLPTYEVRWVVIFSVCQSTGREGYPSSFTGPAREGVGRGGYPSSPPNQDGEPTPSPPNPHPSPNRSSTPSQDTTTPSLSPQPCPAPSQNRRTPYPTLPYPPPCPNPPQEDFLVFYFGLSLMRKINKWTQFWIADRSSPFYDLFDM